MILRPEDCETTVFNVGSSWCPVITGVRIKHIPSGLVVSCTKNRDSFANHRDALLELEKQVAAVQEPLSFEDAVAQWKDSDGWRFADSEAAWKFMFEKGAESVSNKGKAVSGEDHF